jgi:hypothetical protein
MDWQPLDQAGLVYLGRSRTYGLDLKHGNLPGTWGGGRVPLIPIRWANLPDLQDD